MVDKVSESSFAGVLLEEGANLRVDQLHYNNMAICLQFILLYMIAKKAGISVTCVVYGKFVDARCFLPYSVYCFN